MIRFFQRHALRCIAVPFALMFALAASGQSSKFRAIEEPRWLKLRITEKEAGVYAEGIFEETTFGDGRSFTHNSLFVGPSMGLDMQGSVYHPYLFRFRMSADGSYGWGQDTVESVRGKVERSKMEYLGRFSGSADILANKPYNATVFGNYNHTFRDYDFFNRVIVDSIGYGARAGWENEVFSFQGSYSQYEEDFSGLSGTANSVQELATFSARHRRQSGATSLEYSRSQYTRLDLDRAATGTDQTVTLSNDERFGSRDQYNLRASSSYTRRESIEDPLEQINANAGLTIEHRHNLDSSYNVNFDRFNNGNFTSDNYSGFGIVRHQLYESLTSTLQANAANFETSSGSDSGYSRHFGGGIGEGYTKRLGAEHRLRVGLGLNVQHSEQQSISMVQNERHSFTEVDSGVLGSFFLNLPNVAENTIVVRDDTGREFFRGRDYGVRTLGPRTLIQKTPGSFITSSTVVVDYRAEPGAAGSYESLTDFVEVRFELWKNFWAIYGRISSSMNNAPAELHVPNLTTFTFGTDVNWRWLRTGAEYETFSSDETDYQAIRLYQSMSFRPDPASSMAVELSQGWATYNGGQRTEQNYRLITGYHRTFTPRLRIDLDGGVHFRVGPGVDQTLATLRPSLNYRIGRTVIKMAYDFEYQIALRTEERQRHMFFVSARRSF